MFRKRNRGGRIALLALLCCAAWACRAQHAVPDGSLTFERDGKVLKSASLASLAEHVPLTEVETEDPYYKRHKRFRAFPVAELLQHVFGASLAELKQKGYVLTALDGYAVTVTGEKLLDGTAYLAIDDLDVPGFAPIGPRKASPAPSYLVWKGDSHRDLESHPRPWQLARLGIADARALYPHTLPRGEAENSAALRGYHLFQERCIRCHAINREGGRVGPDLNVPQSIVAYRPEPQIRAYIKNPLTFRYGTMPPNSDLSEEQLDTLIAYLTVMSKQPYDPEARAQP